MTKALAKREGFSLVPQTLQEAKELANIMASSDLVPKDYKGKPQNVMIAVQMGLEVGLSPMQAVQGIAIINGRPCIWGDAALGLVLSHPDCEDITEECDGKVATCTVKRKGRSATVRTFSLDDAKAAGLLGKQGPWTQYRSRMLQMRARGFALRDCFSDALRGLKLAEEERDTVDVTPAEVKRENARVSLKDPPKSAEVVDAEIVEPAADVLEPSRVDEIRDLIAKAKTLDELQAIAAGIKAANGSISPEEKVGLREVWALRKQDIETAEAFADEEPPAPEPAPEPENAEFGF